VNKPPNFAQEPNPDEEYFSILAIRHLSKLESTFGEELRRKARLLAEADQRAAGGLQSTPLEVTVANLNTAYASLVVTSPPSPPPSPPAQIGLILDKFLQILGILSAASGAAMSTFGGQFVFGLILGGLGALLVIVGFLAKRK